MSLNSNKELVRRTIEEVYNKGNLDFADVSSATMGQLHDPTMPALPTGPEGVKLFARTLRDAFPDLNIKIDHMVAEGDFVTTRYRVSGTHQAPFLGVAPTHRFATIEGMTMYRIEHDRIAEAWLQWDVLGLMHNMGVELPIRTGLEVHL